MNKKLEEKATDYASRAAAIGWHSLIEWNPGDQSVSVEAWDPSNPDYRVIVTWTYNATTDRVHFIQARRVQKTHQRTFKNANETLRHMRTVSAA